MFQYSKNESAFVLKEHLRLLAFIFIFGYISSFMVFSQIWNTNFHFLHTSFELFGLFLMIFTFLQVWGTYSEANGFTQWVGFGTFAMVFLNLPHLINISDIANLNSSFFNSIIDLSLKHGVLTTFFELLIWLLLGCYRKGCTINKWTGLLSSAGIAVLFFVICSNVVNHIPDFYSRSIITINKHHADVASALAALYIIFVYRAKHRESSDDREKVMYEYIMLSLCMFIPARLCFAASDALSSPEQFIGHIFKLAYYGFVYYGVYKATVEYPYTQVRKVKDFYKRLLDASPIGIITFSPDGAINYISKQCDDLFRHDMEKLHGITLDKFLADMELYGLKKLELLERLFKLNEGSVTFCAKPNIANGQGGKLIFTVMKLPMGMAVAVRDAKKAQAIENMQLQTQTILDSTDNMVFILDINRKVVMCNKKFLQVTNTKADDIVGRDLMDMSRFFSSNLKDTSQINVGNEKMMRNTKWNITTRDGESRRISLDSAPILDVDNEKIGWIVIGRDITDYEKEQERIIHNEKMAVIGQMAAGLVHEIKNPLASIKGLCQLLQIKGRVDKVADYAAVMENAVDDIGEIVTNFLQFSKPVTGDMEKASLKYLVQSLEMMISTNAYKHGIKARFYYSDTEEPVLISSQQIKNAVLGMVDNAIDAMRGAIDPELEISTKHEAAHNKMCIEIKDNGIGMTDEQMACIGTPFYTTKPKGTGLGVSVIKYIINEHGGNLKIESKFGEGTIFTIILPGLGTK